MAYNVAIKAYGPTTELVVSGDDTPPPAGSTYKYYNGSAWVDATMKVYDGSAWQTVTPQVAP